MQVHEHMSQAPLTISSDVEVPAAMRLLEERKVRRLPVTDASGRVVGMVTERDLLLAASHYLNAPVDVESIMTRKVVATRADVSLVEAAELMVEHKIGGLPVVDEEQRVIGIITESDIFRAFVALHNASRSVGGT